MKPLLIALLLASAGTPALAQHTHHTMPMPAAEPPHQPAATPAPTADPHAGHGMSTVAPASPPPAAEPHAGHNMTRMAPVPPALPADPHAGHGMGAEVGPAPPPETPPPAAAFSGPRHAADLLFDPAAMREAREQLRAEQGEMRTYRVLVDQFEARVHDGRDGYKWDVEAWYGGDIDKLWLESEGEGSFGEKLETLEVHVLWSHAITPWFDAQAGVRYDFRPDPERGYLVLGLQGLVPYFFEIDAEAFLSEKGDVSARLEAEYDLLITQRLILQPRAEVGLAVQEVRELGLGSGFTEVELGLRLRYEFLREFAPYVGVNWERKLGDTADFARDEDEDVDSLSFVAGVRIWF